MTVGAKFLSRRRLNCLRICLAPAPKAQLQLHNRRGPLPMALAPGIKSLIENCQRG
jgi:hypothetical protein